MPNDRDLRLTVFGTNVCEQMRIREDVAVFADDESGADVVAVGIRVTLRE